MNLPNATRSVLVDAITTLIGSGGKWKFRTSGDAVLATLSLSTAAMAAASNGVGTFNAITADSNAAGGGDIAKVTIEKSDNTIVLTLTAGNTSGFEVNMTKSGVTPPTAITVSAGDNVSVAGATLTMPAS